MKTALNRAEVTGYCWGAEGVVILMPRLSSTSSNEPHGLPPIAPKAASSLPPINGSNSCIISQVAQSVPLSSDFSTMVHKVCRLLTASLTLRVAAATSSVELLLSMTNPAYVEACLYGPLANHIDVVGLQVRLQSAMLA